MPDITDERNRPIAVMVNRSIKGKMPAQATRQQWAAYHAAFRYENTTARGLAVEVYRGFSFCPVYTGSRKQTNFVEAWHIGFDFDHAGLETVCKNPMADTFASFAYSTPSSTIDNPRCRVVFVFDAPITTPELYRNLHQAMAWRFALDGLQTDPSCKDVLRIFYGSPQCGLWPNWSILPLLSCFEIIEQWKEAIPSDSELQSVVVATPREGTLSDKFLQAAAEMLLKQVSSAPDGEKHYTLRRIAYTFGGYVAQGYYNEADAISWLETAILDHAADKKAAKRTIRECLAAGKGKPLPFERKITLEPII